MKIHPLHAWNLTAAEAVALQRQLAGRIETGPPLTRCNLVAGADISYNRFSDVLYAAVVVLRVADGTLEPVTATTTTTTSTATTTTTSATSTTPTTTASTTTG